jgi:hypothetical protein
MATKDHHVLIDALIDLPAHLRQRLVSALRSGLLGPPYTAASIGSVVNAGVSRRVAIWLRVISSDVKIGRFRQGQTDALGARLAGRVRPGH